MAEACQLVGRQSDPRVQASLWSPDNVNSPDTTARRHAREGANRSHCRTFAHMMRLPHGAGRLSSAWTLKVSVPILNVGSSHSDASVIVALLRPSCKNKTRIIDDEPFCSPGVRTAEPRGSQVCPTKQCCINIRCCTHMLTSCEPNVSSAPRDHGMQWPVMEDISYKCCHGPGNQRGLHLMDAHTSMRVRVLPSVCEEPFAPGQPPYDTGLRVAAHILIRLG